MPDDAGTLIGPGGRASHKTSLLPIAIQREKDKTMRITINGQTTDRGNTKEERAAASALIQRNVRCRYTPQSKQRAKDFARSQA